MMLRNVFLTSVREQRRSLAWWVAGMGALNIVTMLFYPSFAELPEINEILEDAGPLLQAFVGDIEDFTSPEGFVDAELFAFMVPLLFIALGILGGSGAVAGEEERGTLDLLLSNPLNRWRVVVDKFAANMVVLVVLAVGTWGGLVVGALAVSMDISLARMAEATVSAALLGAAFGTLALALGSWRGKRGAAAGIAAAAAVGSYLLNSFAPLVDAIEPLKNLSLFHYYSSARPLVNGLDPAHALVLAAATLTLLAAALVMFERRDLGVG